MSGWGGRSPPPSNGSPATASRRWRRSTTPTRCAGRRERCATRSSATSPGSSSASPTQPSPPGRRSTGRSTAPRRTGSSPRSPATTTCVPSSRARAWRPRRRGSTQPSPRSAREVVETDLGEWIIQLAGHTPSHIIAPAVHLDRFQIAEILRRQQGEGEQPLGTDPQELAGFARRMLRDRFLDRRPGHHRRATSPSPRSGSIVLVDERGQRAAQLTSLPRVHVAVMGIERIVETWDAARPDDQPARPIGAPAST